MEEKSRTNEKLCADTVISGAAAPGAPAGGAERKAKPRANGGKKAQKCDSNSKQMRVIEGGARKRPPDVKDHIGLQLKAIYDDVLKQPVPARFTDLLQELASKSKTAGK
jgi:hypothetical protein